jgi:hypothetical protein
MFLASRISPIELLVEASRMTETYEKQSHNHKLDEKTFLPDTAPTSLILLLTLTSLQQQQTRQPADSYHRPGADASTCGVGRVKEKSANGKEREKVS